MGIAPQIADYMQRAIDSSGPADKKIIMPEDFAKHCQEPKVIWAGHKNLSIADLTPTMHDRARNKAIQTEDLKFLLSKGNDFVKAYYMHFILDYLNHPTIREFMKQGDSISDCVDKYVKNKVVTFPGTNQSLSAVVEFLKANSEELQAEYNLK
ncbi:MAG: hypothetical protein HYX80_06515 [Chloroflexi bacterium]|nr:hypothetical protein [Chloroflexota bacterium]